MLTSRGQHWLFTSLLASRGKPNFPLFAFTCRRSKMYSWWRQLEVFIVGSLIFFNVFLRICPVLSKPSGSLRFVNNFGAAVSSILPPALVLMTKGGKPADNWTGWNTSVEGVKPQYSLIYSSLWRQYSRHWAFLTVTSVFSQNLLSVIKHSSQASVGLDNVNTYAMSDVGILSVFQWRCRFFSFG